MSPFLASDLSLIIQNPRGRIVIALGVFDFKQYNFTRETVLDMK